MHTAHTSLLSKLNASRQELLDLGLRNPLLNYKLSSARGVQVVGGHPQQVLDLLVQQGRPLSFLPGPANMGSPSEEEQTARLTDTRLQTPEPPAKLESRLKNTYYAARTSLEEQGVNILYLALGMLHWYEADSSQEPRLAPLVLVPVDLERTQGKERYRLRFSGADIESNLSVQAKLKGEFGLELPLFADAEETALFAYFDAVAEAMQSQPRWQVDRQAIHLGFFSFGKFMLYRDLDLSLWPEEANTHEHPILNALFETGFQDPEPTVGEEAFLDHEPSTHQLHQVVDADSSQLLAMLAVQEGRNLVIQGPPGTGKSQTITNLLAEAIGAGKKVLFVAEKMAALEVVKRRLDTIGLGAACLELHSHKANKKALHEELKRTLDLNKPVLQHLEQEVALLDQHREELNSYCLALNQPIGRSTLTTQQVLGELLQLARAAKDISLPRLPFRNMAAWSGTDMQRLETLADRMQAFLIKTGSPPKELLFWGSGLKVLLPARQDELSRLLQQALHSLEPLEKTAAGLATTLGLPAPTERTAAEALLLPARQALAAPALAGINVTGSAWLHQHHELQALLGAGSSLHALKQKHQATLLPEAWELDVLNIRTQLLAYGSKWWNFLISDYRKARKQLQGLSKKPLPQEPGAQLAVVDDILTARRNAATLQQHHTLATLLFGAHWKHERSDWKYLHRVSQYLHQVHEEINLNRLPAQLLAYLDKQPDTARLSDQIKGLEQALADHRTAISTLTDALELDETKRFGTAGRLQLQPFASQKIVLQTWLQRLPELQLPIDWNNLVQAAKTEGIEELATLAEHWPLAHVHLKAVLQQGWLEYLLGQAYKQHEPLRKFERAGHEEAIRKFKRADMAQLHFNRARAALAHWQQVPRHQAGGQLGVLRTEFNRKARHLPIRRLMEQAGLAVQAIKPVFMMSPLSIANFIPPGILHFDLVVFDEASQVKPVDALGAIMRGRQLVVVGDSKQLPPTSFFDSLTSNPAADDEDNITADMQSILGLCEARQAPQRMLRWHYRSLHESLIQLSNQEFYENRLVIFPSPGHKAHMGLVFNHLPGTVYERGTTRTNPLEAAAVADAVMAHARKSPHLSLGVVAFSTVQRQAIEDALEQRRRNSPEVEEFFSRHPHEPFFIKNLENVQGDERDVMFISLGYGRTKEGYLPMSFGPLNGDGGERRLNVLITRAKQRCEVFSNFTADDLDLARTNARGVVALKSFLYFAQHGRLNMPVNTGLEAQSPFEEAVFRDLTACGYIVRKQVGSEGFFIDLAVVDPEHPGRYLLGIECDGAMYHSARSARDRDRLRQQVLEAVGWQLHRIWSTDWFRDPKRELERVITSIEQAKLRLPLTEPEEEDQSPAFSTAELLREEDQAAHHSALPLYQMAALPRAIAERDLHLHATGQLAVWVKEVVMVESPVHEAEVARRIVEAAGLARTGSRIKQALERAAHLAVQTGAIIRKGEFLWQAGMQTPPLRDRSQLPAASRKLTHIAPEELALAVQAMVHKSFALSREEAAALVARQLGFSRISEDMRQQLQQVIDQVIDSGALTETNGLLKPVPEGGVN